MSNKLILCMVLMSMAALHIQACKNDPAQYSLQAPFDKTIAINDIMAALDDINTENPGTFSQAVLNCIRDELEALTSTELELLIYEDRDGREFTAAALNSLTSKQMNAHDDFCDDDEFGICRVVMHCATGISYEELIEQDPPV